MTVIKERVVTWRVIPSAGFETAWVAVDDSMLTARGRAMGTEPFPYWVHYRLETDANFVTRLLKVKVEATDVTSTLELRNESGHWSANGEPFPDVEGALDCDLGLCPLTNTMPILRHSLHKQAGRQEFLMAWVAVPELTVHPSRQTYTHLATTPEGAQVRYESGDFTSDLLIDNDGLVVEYPQLATRVSG